MVFQPQIALGNLEWALRSLSGRGGLFHGEPVFSSSADLSDPLAPALSIQEKNGAVCFNQPWEGLSGDLFYDRMLPNGERFLFFADAAGHGVEAYLLAEFALAFLEEIFQEEKPDSRELLKIAEKLNGSLEELNEGLITALFLSIDAKLGLRMINYGHPPPLIYSVAEKEIKSYYATHPPLGACVGLPGKCSFIQLKPGDKLFLYTDGLYENQSPEADPYPVERVETCFKEHINEQNKNSEIMKGMLHSFLPEINRPLDDVSAILLEIPPAPQSAPG